MTDFTFEFRHGNTIILDGVPEEWMESLGPVFVIGGGGGGGGPHTHFIADVQGLRGELDGKAPIVHAHTIAQVTGLEDALAEKAPAVHNHSWAAISDPPAAFPPAAHSHPLESIDGLPAALEARLPASAASPFGLTLMGAASNTVARTTLGLGAASTWAAVPNNHVNNARAADMPAMRIKGNATAASADPQDLTVEQIKIMLSLGIGDIAGLAAALADAGGGTAGPHTHPIAEVDGLAAALMAKLDAALATPYGLSLLAASGAPAARTALGLGGLAMITYANTENIEDNAITNAEAADMPARTIKGNAGNALADPQDLTVAQLKALLALGIGDVANLQSNLNALSARLLALEEGGSTPPPVAPIITTPASITGAGIVGQALTLNRGAASGNPTPTSAVQWLRGSTAISGATGNNYTPVAADYGQTLTARVTWTNSAGSAQSSPTIAIAPEEVPTGPPLVYSFDWESGNNAGNIGWDAASSAIVTTPTLGGQYAARVTGSTTGWGFQLPLGAVRNEIYMRQKVRLDVSVEPTEDWWFKILQIGHATGWLFTLNHDCYPGGESRLDWWVGPAGTMTGPSALIPRGETFDLEIYIRIATSGGRIITRVNGTTIIDWTGNTGSAGIDRINYLAQDTTLMGAAFNHYFDDHIGAVEDWPQYDGGGSGGGPGGGDPPPESGTLSATGVSSGVQPGRLGLANSDGDYKYTAYGTPAQITADVASMGAKWVRSDMRTGDIRQTRGGTPSWGFYDNIVNTFTANGGKFLPILMPGGWLGQGMTTSQNRNDFRDHAVECVNRYKDRVKHWQIMNELNLDTKMTPANYAALLNLIYPAMKAADPDCTIILHGSSSVENTVGAHIGALAYLQGIFANGAGNSFDAIAHHPYTVWSTPDDWQAGSWHGWQIMYGLHDYLVTQGQGHKQIWVTEYGQAVDGTGDDDATSPEHQLLTLQQAYDRLVRDDRFGPLFIYTHRDRPTGTGSEAWFGLKARDGTLRPAYSRFQQIDTRDDNARVLRPSSGTYQYFAGRLFEVAGNPRRTGVTYSMTAKAGMSINAATGIVSIAASTTAGSVTITATMGAQTATATLNVVTS